MWYRKRTLQDFRYLNKQKRHERRPLADWPHFRSNTKVQTFLPQMIQKIVPKRQLPYIMIISLLKKSSVAKLHKAHKYTKAHNFHQVEFWKLTSELRYSKLSIVSNLRLEGNLSLHTSLKNICNINFTNLKRD